MLRSASVLLSSRLKEGGESLSKRLGEEDLRLVEVARGDSRQRVKLHLKVLCGPSGWRLKKIHRKILRDMNGIDWLRR